MFRISFALCAALIVCFEHPVHSDDRLDSALLTDTSASQTEAALNDSALASHDSGPGRSDLRVFKGIPIEHGTVVLQGRKLPAPYVVSRTRGEVLVNGEVITRAPKDSPEAARQLAAQVERTLFDGHWVVIFGEGIVTYADGAEGGMVLIGSLARAETLTERVRLVMEAYLEGADQVTTAEWKTALQNFQPDELIVEQFKEYQRSTAAEAEPVEESTESPLLAHDSTQTMYGLSVVGMLLIALSAGTLLGNPPKNAVNWSRIVRSPRTLAAMQRCLLLIAAYSLFDLIATVMALKTGHVEELNPLGVGLILAPAALAAFKVSATCLGTGLLWKLKNYHGAQVASWWLCMILTLVTVRWVTVQSLFFV